MLRMTFWIFLITILTSTDTEAWQERLFLPHRLPLEQQPYLVDIAILDTGFKGYEQFHSERVTFYRPPAGTPSVLDSDHGTRMAQIVESILSFHFPYVIDYKIHLLPARGITQFKDSLQKIQRLGNINIVLYAHVWNVGGFGDGGGFINPLVEKTIRSTGVTWINAAGNYRQNFYSQPVRISREGILEMPGPHNTLRVECHNELCPVNLVLTWNRFPTNLYSGTEHDLDLLLLDEEYRIIARSDLVQVTRQEQAGPSRSLFPRENLQVQVPKGSYRLRVVHKKGRFDPRWDKLRILATGAGVFLPDANAQTESLLPPADSPYLITVGSDDQHSSQSLTMRKPELTLPSSVGFSDGPAMQGSSSSAAQVAALAAFAHAFRPTHYWRPLPPHQLVLQWLILGHPVPCHRQVSPYPGCSPAFPYSLIE